MTKRAKPVFTVKEYHDGQPWICVEFWTADDGMPMDLYGFDVEPGTSLARAKEIADYMQDNLTNFTITKLP